MQFADDILNALCSNWIQNKTMAGFILIYKKEFRVLIKHYLLRGNTITKTEKKLKKYYSNSAPSHDMAYKWFTEFRCGHMSTTYAERCGCPVDIKTEEMINKIHDLVLKDRRVKVSRDS